MFSKYTTTRYLIAGYKTVNLQRRNMVEYHLNQGIKVYITCTKTKEICYPFWYNALRRTHHLYGILGHNETGNKLKVMDILWNKWPEPLKLSIPWKIKTIEWIQTRRRLKRHDNKMKYKTLALNMAADDFFPFCCKEPNLNSLYVNQQYSVLNSWFDDHTTVTYENARF
jgi:hypothetical protein